MSLVKRGKVYYAVVRVSGAQKWIRCHTDPRIAGRMHGEIVASIAAGSFVQPSTVTFREFADEFRRDYCSVRLKPSTYAEYDSYLRNHLVPYFGDTRLSAVTTRQIQAYVADKMGSGALAPKSVRNQLVVLKRLFAVAVEWDVIERNPAARASAPRVPRQEMRFLRPDEVHRLIACAEPEYRLLIATACLVGARKGELTGLKWDCVSLRDRTITIKRSVYAGRLQEPKSTRSVRVLPMPDALVELFASVRVGAPHAFVFHGASDDTPLANGTPNRVLRRALKRAGLDETLTFHCLRHSFVAMAIAAGVPVKVIQDLAGHSSITVTMDRYGHLMPGAQAAAVQSISSLVYGAETPPAAPSPLVGEPPETVGPNTSC